MTTRIWYENDAIQMDGLEAQPARSLSAVLDGDRVHIFTLSGLRLAQLMYGEYARKDGTGFASAAATKTYLDGEFAKVPVPSWDSVTGKPASYSPSAHTHPWGDITGKPTSYPPSAHSHTIADVTSLQAALDGKQAAGVGLAALVGTVTVAETAAVAILAGVRKVTVAVPSAIASSVVVGGNYLLFPIGATPAGYALADVVATAAGTLQVTVTTPAIVLGGNYSMPCRLVRINT